MGCFSSGASAPTTQFSTQTTTADPRAQAMYSQAWRNARNVASRPFQPYSNDPNAFVAPLNSTQLTAINNIYGQQNAGQQYYEAAPGMAYNAGNTMSAGLAPQYMSPYLDSVVNSTMGLLGQQQALERNRLNGQIAANGQWGNERSGIERALLSGQQDLAAGNILSNLYNSGYNTALGAAQTDLNRQLQASGSLAGQGLQGSQALLQAGTLGQQTQQAGLQALYNQYLMQQQYPFQTAQFLASTAAGLGPGYGSTTSGYQTSMQPLSYFGNPLSDPALKVGAEGDEPEIIGQTNDGQDIYRYRVVNPDTGELGPVQIGLMADEVEQRRPDAIGDYKGYRTVDYAKATDDAARLGGGVMGRGDYADGGGIGDLLRSHEAMYAGLGKMPGGIVPQAQMAVAKLDSPTLSFARPEQKEKGSSIGDLLSNAKGALDLFKTGKGLYDDWKTPASTDTTMSRSAEASGGSVYSLEPDATQGPSSGVMPTAALNAPTLRFVADKKDDDEGGGIGSALKSAAGIAGSLKTLWDVGSTVGPMLMSLSDRRLKTGVRPGFATEGGVDSEEDLFDRLLGQESGRRQFERDGSPVTSSKGATGVAQIMPGTMPEAARYAGLEPSMERLRSDPEYNKALGRAYLKHQMEQFGGDREMALGAYNAGPSRVERAVAKANLSGGDWKNYMPRETQAYIPAVMGGGLGRAMALAPKEAGSKNEALAAIDDATKPRGVMPANDDSSPAQGLSGFLRGKPASGLGEKALDFATSERFLIPLLTGLGTMASSGSRYLAPAILQGLGAGAKSYMEIPKVQAETDLAKAEALNKRTLNDKFAAEAGQVLANTNLVKAQTAKDQADTVNSAVVEKGGRLFVRVVRPNGLYDLMPFGEWNGMDPTSRPPLVPGDNSSGQPSSPTSPNSGAVTPPAAGGAPAGQPSPGSFDLSPDQASEAQKAAAAKAGWSTTNQSSVPDFFAPQADIAKSAQDQKQIIIPLASSLAQLPKGSSLLASGKAQEFLSPLAATLNNLASVAGFKGMLVADPKALANQEEVKKLVTQLQREATTSSQMHAYHAFKDMAEGIPGIFTSPEGQGKLIAQILTNTQRQIDKNEFFSKWAKAAGGKNGSYGEWARLTSPEANLAFDNNKGTNARYATDREMLEKMFNDRVMLTDDNGEPVLGPDGLPQKMSLLAAVATHPDILKSPAYRKAFEEKYPPSILRYFGIQ